MGTQIRCQLDKNHSGADLFPDSIDEYLRTELTHNAVMGPFTIPPFVTRIGISPLNSREKRDSNKRRIILDLSYPPGYSVNDGIDKNIYCGKEIHLKYPSIDTMAQRIAKIGKGAKIWKLDLLRAFRQLPLCPRDYSLIGYRWRSHLYFDKRMPMGLRTAAYCCQAVTNAITYVHTCMGYWSTNYLDDIGSAEREDEAWASFLAMRRLLANLGAQEAVDKACPPSTRMEFLGILIDTIKLTLEVTPQRLLEIKQLVVEWLNKEKATRKNLESLIGKLAFVATCVRGGRVFISRLISALNQFTHVPSSISEQIKLDVRWWHRFLEKYNGVSILWLHEIQNSRLDTCY